MITTPSGGWAEQLHPVGQLPRPPPPPPPPPEPFDADDGEGLGVPAGTGGRIVRAHDEEFMQAAWDQLGQVLEANRRIRAAQVARELTFVYHRRQLEPLRLSAQRCPR